MKGDRRPGSGANRTAPGGSRPGPGGRRSEPAAGTGRAPTGRRALLAAAAGLLVLAAPGCGQEPVQAGGATVPEVPPGVPTSGIWLDRDELSALPTSGEAWRSVRRAADGPCGRPDLAEREDDADVCVLAKALVFARTGREGLRAQVAAALEHVAEAPYAGRALALGRNLAAYVISADLIDLEGYAPELERAFRDRLAELPTTYTEDGPDDLVECHEIRANNWGTHCGASLAAIAAYLDDRDGLDRVARVFRGYLGDRSSYAGFEFGEAWWQCDPDRPVGINPAGCTREGHPIGGVLADDQRRGGRFEWPPPRENYVWEGLQGALVQAMILHRQGYPAFEWEDRALLRAVRWLHDEAAYPASGDDTWQPHLVNHVYGTDFPAPVPSAPGKNVGWTDWTHGTR